MIETLRLVLVPLEKTDNTFILELVNTDGWIKFIGDRNIKTLQDAEYYIQKIKNNKNIQYWVVRSIESNESLGIITFIKREYLLHHDIGFAFLPQYAKKGYAYEAAKAVINILVNDKGHTTIFATTIPANIKSINLLLKLGFIFEKQIEIENEKLDVYCNH